MIGKAHEAVESRAEETPVPPGEREEAKRGNSIKAGYHHGKRLPVRIGQAASKLEKTVYGSRILGIVVHIIRGASAQCFPAYRALLSPSMTRANLSKKKRNRPYRKPFPNERASFWLSIQWRITAMIPAAPAGIVCSAPAQ